MIKIPEKCTQEQTHMNKNVQHRQGDKRLKLRNLETSKSASQGCKQT